MSGYSIKTAELEYAVEADDLPQLIELLVLQSPSIPIAVYRWGRHLFSRTWERMGEERGAVDMLWLSQPDFVRELKNAVAVFYDLRAVFELDGEIYTSMTPTLPSTTTA